MTVEELCQFLPHLPIKDIIQLPVEHGVGEPVSIQVGYPKYLAKIDAIVASVPPESLAAYQYWQAFQQTDVRWSTS